MKDTKNKLKLVYDIGSNNGDDILYYLKKGHRVVAIEANPLLCARIRERFSTEIERGLVIIENCVLTSKSTSKNVTFYIHKKNHVLSQFPTPKHPGNFQKTLLPSRTVNQLLQKHGRPYYVKIDIEHYDHIILRSLFNAGSRPRYISAESHSVEVFLLLTSLGGYSLFKIVDGRSVSTKYGNCRIKTFNGRERYSFPFHSAGPYGEDIVGDWDDSESIFNRLQSGGLGWKDIHAKRNGRSRDTAKTMIPWQAIYWYYKIRWILRTLIQED